MRILSFLLFTSVLCVPVSARGLLIWDYFSTDGTSTLSGQLTTAGSPGQELVVGNSFALISIDTVFVDGVDITGAANWNTDFGGQPPPFSSFPIGSLTVVSPSIGADLGSGLGAGDGALNSVFIASPGQGQLSSAGFVPGGFDQHTSFEPTMTTFTAVPIPEPSTLSYLIGAGLLGLAKVRAGRNRARRATPPA